MLCTNIVTSLTTANNFLISLAPSPCTILPATGRLFSITRMKLSIDRHSAVPLHKQAENLLRDLIKDPVYQTGKLLPKEVDLAEMLAISRSTLRQAINKLVFNKLLIRKKGVGTKVAYSDIRSKSENWMNFSQEMKACGMTSRNYELHISWVLPDEHIADIFKIAPGKKVIKLERVRGNNEAPSAYFISFFHPRIGLTGDEDFQQPLYEMIEREYAIVATLSKEEISAQIATKHIAEKLDTETATAILLRKRLVFDQHDLPMEYNLRYYKADSFIYTTESRRTT